MSYSQLDLAEQYGTQRAIAALDSEDVVQVLIEHQRKDITCCCCGWSKLGHSHAEHVLSEIVKVVRAVLVRES